MSTTHYLSTTEQPSPIDFFIVFPYKQLIYNEFLSIISLFKINSIAMPENSSMRNPITQFPLISTLRYFNYYNIQPTLASVITPFSNAHSNLPQASAAIVLNAPQKKAKGADRRPGAINKVGILVI
jgi:hypothetical protein